LIVCSTTLLVVEAGGTDNGATKDVVEGGGGGGAGAAGVTPAALTVVYCTILVFPAIVVALVTVAVGTNGCRPPNTGSQICPPSCSRTVGRESIHATTVAGGTFPGCRMEVESAIRDGQTRG